MRSTKKVALVLLAGGLSAFGLRDDVRATGTIDIAGAAITIGAAPVPGTTTIDESASLGTPPHLEAPGNASRDASSYTELGAYDNLRVTHQGLGGPDFRAQVDLTLPGGTYDYGSFTVDRGVTVTFTGTTTLRTTNSMRIDGRVEISGAGLLKLDCLGDLTMVGHDDPVKTGLFAHDESGSIEIGVGGVMDTGAEAHAKVWIQSDGGGGNVIVYCDKQDPLAVTSFADTVFEVPSTSDTLIVATGAGRLELTNCTGKGATLEVAAPQWQVAPDLGENELPDSVIVSGGTFEGLYVSTHWNVQMNAGVSVTGGRSSGIRSLQGRISLSGGSSLVCDGSIVLSGESVTIGDGCEVRTTGLYPGNPMMIVAGWNSPLGITVGAGATVEDRSGGQLVLNATRGVHVYGTVRGYGDSAELSAVLGDVTIAEDADVDAPNGTLRLLAGGAVAAEGGRATLTAREYDVRCVTGDLDLDVDTLEATAGRFVALSNGTVRLRGTYRAAGDVQVISLKDSIDVEGATLETSDAGAAPSGFLRLATYAATTIAAGGSSLTTGDSDAQSGDVLIQIEADGTDVAEGTLSVQRVVARRMPDGVATRISGTLTAAGLRAMDLSGTARVAAGGVSRRVYLQGSKSKFDGANEAVSLRVMRTGKTRARFVLELHENAATDGEQSSVRFSRAGLRAQGKFRRPHAK